MTVIAPIYLISLAISIVAGLFILRDWYYGNVNVSMPDAAVLAVSICLPILNTWIALVAICCMISYVVKVVHKISKARE